MQASLMLHEEKKGTYGLIKEATMGYSILYAQQLRKKKFPLTSEKDQKYWTGNYCL